MTEEEAGEVGMSNGSMSNGCISFDNVEFLLKLDLEDGHFAEAGVVGVLNALLDIKEV